MTPASPSDAVPDFRSVTVEELARRIRERELTAAAVTDAALERIEATNPVLNAFVAVDDGDARAQAAAIDERLDAGDDVGPLAGIPIGVKDWRMRPGPHHPRRDAPARRGSAEQDATEVARLRAAGCVVVGKTNTPENGWTADTYNPLFGATVSPWDTTRSAGGSSGGTSSAVASGMVPLGTGSDGGGSIRIPVGTDGHVGAQAVAGTRAVGTGPDGCGRPLHRRAHGPSHPRRGRRARRGGGTRSG